MQDAYSAKTKGAKDVIDNTLPVAERALAELLPNFSADQFTLADYGAADGGTSLSLMRAILDKVSAAHPDLALHLNYSDLPDNDFNAIGKMLFSLPGTDAPIQHTYPNLTVSTSPVSFYERILPPQQLSFGFSATAMHWLEHAPIPISDHVHIAASQDSAAQAAYRQKAHEDLLRIFSHRAAEMHPGAYFLLVNFGIDGQGRFLGNTDGVHMFNNFYHLLQEMEGEGRITAEEIRQVNFPQYYRSAADYHALVNDDRMEGKLEVVSIDDLHTVCPYREQLRASGNYDRFIKEYPGTLETWSYHVFFQGLSTERSEAERHALVRSFYDRYRAQIAKNPDDHGMDYVHHLVLLRRV